MMIVDMLLKPADTYWKKQHHAEEIRRRKAEADAQYFQQTCEQQEKDIALLSERDIKQARALEVMGRELEQMRKAKEEYLEYAKRQEREMELLREALRSEREAKAAFRNSAMLWESLKARDNLRADAEKASTA